jgi:hypothetical protein
MFLPALIASLKFTASCGMAFLLAKVGTLAMIVACAFAIFLLSEARVA